MLPADRQAYSVLELFLFGGLSQYESFYLVDAHGASSNTHWHLFRDEIESTLTECGVEQDALFDPFADDALGNTVALGPFAAPLRARPDLVERMRIIATAHDASPHEVAIPLALTGRTIGHPGLCGMGAHVQRYFQEREGIVGRPAYSYVLQPSSSLQGEFVRAAAATGVHPGDVRPLALRTGAVTNFLEQLGRPAVGGRAAAYDRLIAANTQRHRARLTPAGMTEPGRSRAFRSFEASSSAVANSQSLAEVLEPRLFEPIGLDACGVDRPAYETALNLRLAAHLLTHETAPARYVCVVDGGVDPVANAAGGYDTHDRATPVQAVNLLSVLESLASIINAPGEGDPGKLDLDRTLVIINTEFGRTPDEQGTRGRGHWPGGYPVVMMGGPVRRGGAAVVGGIDRNALAVSGATPVSNRVAVLLALGIWPFEQESFNVADGALLGEPPPGTELDAAQTLCDLYFGA